MVNSRINWNIQNILSLQYVSTIIELISSYLATVFISFIASGVFLDLMKQIKVILFFKSVSSLDPSNSDLSQYFQHKENF